MLVGRVGLVGWVLSYSIDRGGLSTLVLVWVAGVGWVGWIEGRGEHHAAVAKVAAVGEWLAGMQRHASFRGSP